jgi:hypothetical protein
MAEAVSYSERIDTCLECQTEGDFLNENDAKIEEVLAEARKASAKGLIESLAADGISMAFFERALELAPRTLARWKSGASSASSLALLRFVRTFPWLLRVGEESFSPVVARDELIKAAMSALGDEGGARARAMLGSEFSDPLLPVPSVQKSLLTKERSASAAEREQTPPRQQGTRVNTRSRAAEFEFA